MGLRDYQQEDVGRLRQAVNRSGSVVYVLPTGGGKTVVAGEIARLAAAKGSPTLFLVHRRELVKQASSTLKDAVPGTPIGIEAAGWPRNPWALLQVGSVQTVVRRDVRKPKLIIVDEAHHARAKTWEVVLDRWPRAKRIGLTATPERLDGKGLGEHFAEMVLGPTIPELVEDGHLAPCRVLRIPSGLRLEGLKKDKNGEFTRSAMGKRVTGAVVASAVAAYLRYAPGRRAIFFGIHREHSRKVCEGLRAKGVRAAHVDATDPTARRDRVMNALRTGGLDVVGNCDLISEGFDAPACEVVMMGSHTASVTRYLQQAGRAMRPGPDKTALILDLAGNSHHLGLPDDVRDWNLEDGEVVEVQKTRAAPRLCPLCHAVFRGPKCPQCQYQPPLSEIAEVETPLEEATSGRMARPRGRRSEVWRELSEAYKSDDPVEAVKAIGRRRGYKEGWAKHILRAKNLL